jgi:D-beta-D-heptose 7-phosphate kinase/D-beta-D-heptose 1-phosphate adenosyltransferase
MGQVIPREQISQVLAPHRGRDVIVCTNGCFDLLHVGHLRYLQAARSYGDLLVIALNSDASVRGLKGPERPIVPESDRAELLAGLTCVDYVVLFDEPTPVELIREIRPNIQVKGAQYTEETLPEMPVLRELGIELRLVPMVDNRSSTNLIEKIKGLVSAAPTCS